MRKKPVEPVYVVEMGNGELFMGDEAYKKADELRKYGKLIESTRPEVQALMRKKTKMCRCSLKRKLVFWKKVLDWCPCDEKVGTYYHDHFIHRCVVCSGQLKTARFK